MRPEAYTFSTRYARHVIWEPFAMALVLGLAMSAGLYFAYLWPSVEPDDDADTDLEKPVSQPAAVDDKTGDA